MEHIKIYDDAMIFRWYIWLILCDVWDLVPPRFFLKMECSWKSMKPLTKARVFYMFLLYYPTDSFLMANMMSTWFYVVQACFWGGDEWRWSVVAFCRNLYTRCHLSMTSTTCEWLIPPTMFFFSCWMIANKKKELCQFLDCCEICFLWHWSIICNNTINCFILWFSWKKYV